jgi:hypothetical protein
LGGSLTPGGGFQTRSEKRKIDRKINAEIAQVTLVSRLRVWPIRAIFDG